MKNILNFRKKLKPAVNTHINEIIDINRISTSIDKVDKMLVHVRKIGNSEAIQTWERIAAKLQIEWVNALVEIQGNGRYHYI